MKWHQKKISFFLMMCLFLKLRFKNTDISNVFVYKTLFYKHPRNLFCSLLYYIYLFIKLRFINTDNKLIFLSDGLFIFDLIKKNIIFFMPCNFLSLLRFINTDLIKKNIIFFMPYNILSNV